jgi:1-phosphatidylinositol phosphodiesterase
MICNFCKRIWVIFALALAVWCIGCYGSDHSTEEVLPAPGGNFEPTTIDAKNWMKKIIDEKQLNEIVLPGSHDSGMMELRNCNIGAPLAYKLVKTQKLNIIEQLEQGTRYFDFRVDYDKNQLTTYHRTKAVGLDGRGCSGQPIKSALDQTVHFLRQHPSEVAIIKFSHFRSDSGHNPEDTKNRLNALMNNYDEYLYKDASNPNLGNVKINNLRGKIVAVFDNFDKRIDSSKGRFSYSGFKGDGNLRVYDEYTNTTNYQRMKNDQLNLLSTYGSLGKYYFFLLSWTLTQTDPTGKSIETHATEANRKLPNVLYYDVFSKKLPLPNIVFIDFVSRYTNQYIIQYNEDLRRW